jgi:hypothetical protein
VARSWWCTVAVAVACLTASGNADEPLADPFPLRRVQIGPERVAAELERAQKGALVLLPSSDFEARVQRAAQVQEQIASPPILIKARYSARLTDQAIVGGAEWTVIHSRPEPGLLALGSFNLALTKRILVNGSDGILGDLGSKSPCIWIEKHGESSIHFDWSRRGVEHPDGIHFDLDLPACANAWMEIALPSNVRVSADKPGLLIDGPRPAASAGFQSWLLGCGGRSRIEFTVRRLETGPALLVAGVQSQQELNPDRVLADYEFQVESLKGAVHELVLDGDAVLQPYDVLLGGVAVKNWHWLPATSNRAGGILVVPLIEPMQGTLPRLRVRCLALASKGSAELPWTSPAMALRGALSSGESLQLRILPEALVENWRPGAFRLESSKSDADGALVLKLSTSGYNPPRQAANLIDEPLAPALAIAGGVYTGAARRPSAVLRARGTEFLLDQKSWWQIDGRESTLTTELTCKPIQGQLFHLPLKLPPDSQVDEIVADPGEAIRSWSMAGTRTSPLLIIDLGRTQNPAAAVKFALKLRLGARPGQDKIDRVVVLPELEPLVPCLRQGTLAVSVGPGWQAQITESSWPLAQVPDGDGPWKKGLVDFYFAYSGSPLTGAIRLEPRSPRWQARVQSDVYLGGARGTVQVRLTLDPMGGSLEHVDVATSAVLAVPWIARSETPGVRVSELRRSTTVPFTAAFLAVGMRQLCDALPIMALAPGRETWRLEFAEPLRGRATLVLESAFDRAQLLQKGMASPEQFWAIPVVTLPTAAATEGELAVMPVGAEITDVRAHGLQEQPRSGAKNTSAPGLRRMARVFYYAATPPLQTNADLSVTARDAATRGTTEETCEFARLTSWAGTGGPTAHHFHFRLSDWRKSSVAILLPVQAESITARFQGRFLTFAQRAGDEGVEVAMPSSPGVAVQEFDVYYETATNASLALPWAVLESALPRPPVQPLAYEREWLLPAHVVPLHNAWQRVDELQSGKSSQKLGWGHAAWQTGRPLLSSLVGDSAATDWSASQRHFLSTARGRLQARLGAPATWNLGSVVESLASDQTSASIPLIVDASGLAAAGLHTASQFPETADLAGASPWSIWGVELVPTASGILLTTKAQAQAWTASGATDASAPATASVAVAQAAECGHDSSGRFQSALFWIANAGPASGYRHVATHWSAEPRLVHALEGGWARWRAPAGWEAPPSIVVVNSAAFHILGAILSGMLVLAWAPGVRMPRTANHRIWRTRGLLLALAAGALAMALLPGSVRQAAAYPTLAAACLLGISFFVRPLSSSTGSVATLRAKAAQATVPVLAAGLFTLASASAWSQGTDQNLVLVLPGPTDQPEMKDVLAPPELLKRLDAIISRGPLSWRGALLTDAAYTGTLAGEYVQLKAEFQLHSFGDQTTLTVPLTGVELAEGSLLDGAPVQPSAAANGYEVPIKEKGQHRLTLFFSVRLQSNADYKELRFTAPRLHHNTLSLRQPGNWPAPRAISGNGEESTRSIDPDSQQVRVEIGPDALVHLRWETSAGAASRVRITVRDAYYWTLASSGSECIGLLQYTVKNGTASAFAVAIPETLEPRSVAVSSTGAPDAVGPQLRSWEIVAENGQWLLRVHLHTPVSGNVSVALRFVVRQPVGPGTVRLTLPIPLDDFAGGGVAWHSNDFDVTEKAAGPAWTPQPTALFAKQWQAAGGPGVVGPTRAWTYRAHTGSAALILTMSAHRPAVEQELDWTLHTDRAALQATLRATSAHGDLMLLEWDVPSGITVAEVVGDNVRSWSRAAGSTLLQIWLKQPAKNATAIVRGWMLTPKTAAGQAVRWRAPWIRSTNSSASKTLLRVAAGVGTAVAADELSLVNLTRLALASGENFKGSQASYSAEFLVTAAVETAWIQALMVVDSSDGSAQLWGTWQVHVPHGGPATMQVTASPWQGGTIKLEGPADVSIRSRPAPAGERAWEVAVSGTAPRRFALKLSSARPAAPVALVDLPRFQIEGGKWSHQWLLASAGLEPKAMSGLTAVKSSTAESEIPPAILDRAGPGARVWKASGTDWRLTLQVQRKSGPAADRVLWEHEEIAFGDGFGWIHQSNYLVTARDALEWTVKLPQGGTILRAFVDETPVNPRLTASDGLALLAPAGDGPHWLRLRWTTDRETEPLTQPLFAAPWLDVAPAESVQWTLTAPLGYHFRKDLLAANQSPALAAAAQALSRAEAEAASWKAVATQAASGMDASLKARALLGQARILYHARLATNFLLADSDAGATESADKIREQASVLLNRNRTVHPGAGLGFVSAGSSAENVLGPTDRWPPLQGSVWRWQTGREQPEVLGELESSETQERRADWGDSRAVLGVLAVLFLLTYFPTGAARLRPNWPELTAAAFALGVLAWGLSPFAVIAWGVLLVFRMRSIVEWWRQLRDARIQVQ